VLSLLSSEEISIVSSDSGREVLRIIPLLSLWGATLLRDSVSSSYKAEMPLQFPSIGNSNRIFLAFFDLLSEIHYYSMLKTQLCKLKLGKIMDIIGLMFSLWFVT